MNKTKIFAHRGASGYAPENTPDSFRLAMEQGADGIELDVQLTKDQIPVVIHDETTDRVTGAHGLVKDFTLAELQKLSVLSQEFPDYPNAKIPTLREVLELVKPSGMQVNIELKTGIYWYPELEERTVSVVRSCGMESRVIYSSFNHYSIQRLKKIAPNAETAYLYSDVILHVDEYAKETGVDGLHPADYHIKMADFLNEYLESGLKVRVWTVNCTEDMQMLIDAGVEAIITNYPDRALAIRDGLS